MLSYTALQTKCQDGAKDTSASALTFFQGEINEGLREVQSELGSFYTEEEASVTTVASTATYDLPANFIRLKNAYITVSNVRYEMDVVQDEQEWQFYKSNATNSTSDTLQKIIVRRDSFEVYPTPASASLTITLRYEKGYDELTAADYTTGTITTLSNGAAAVTGSGTTWTAAMAGRYLKITSDGTWYKILTFGTTTTLTLDKNYEGLSISAGSEAYIIGDMPIIPEPTHKLLAYYALWQYYVSLKQSAVKADYWRKIYEVGLRRAKRTYSRRYSSRYIAPNRTSRNTVNPNNYPGAIT
jgi:hypothetical protein